MRAMSFTFDNAVALKLEDLLFSVRRCYSKGLRSGLFATSDHDPFLNCFDWRYHATIRMRYVAVEVESFDVVVGSWIPNSGWF